jgi:hypothetical protein
MSCCRAIKKRAAIRSIVFLIAKGRHFDRADLSVAGALSMGASACLSFGTTGTRHWHRWRRLPPSLLLSWWLPALLRWRKVGGDERVRPKIDLAGCRRSQARPGPLSKLRAAWPTGPPRAGSASTCGPSAAPLPRTIFTILDGPGIAAGLRSHATSVGTVAIGQIGA